MIDLGATDFYFGVPNLLRPQFEEYSAQLFDEWEEHVGQTLLLPDYSLALEVEEGSVKGVGKVGAWLAAIYIGVGQYGDFVQGLQTIRAQVSSVGDFLVERAAIPFELTDCEKTVRKRGGSLGRLQRLLLKVQCREMTAEQAMREAETLLGEEALTSPEFMQSLKNSLEQTPLNPEQLSLLLNTPEFEPEVLGSEKERRPRPSRPMPSAPPLQQLRVEVWRESKQGQRKIRVTQI